VLRTTTSKCSFLEWKGRKWRNKRESSIILKGKNEWQSWRCKGLRGREDWRKQNGNGNGREMKKGKNEPRRGKHHDMMNMFMMAFVGRTMSSDDSPAKKKRKTKSDDSDS
jgi:hypothetical protein